MTHTDESLRIGVVGLGISFALMASRLAATPNVRLVAGCDSRPEALVRFQADFGGATYTDFADLCADPAVEAVYLMTPNALHCPQAVMACNHGKHVIVDKPFALSLDECDAMIEAARSNDVLLMCGGSHSLDPGVRAMRNIIASGEFGPCRMINSWNYNDWIYRSRAPWEFAPGSGGNVVFNQGAHQVDIVRLLGGGMVRSVRASTGIWDASRPMEGAYSAFLDFEDGATATLAFSSYAHFDTAELNGWVGEMVRQPEDNILTRTRFEAAQIVGPEAAAKEQARYGSATPVEPHFPELSIYGLTMVSCERADIRQTPEGVMIHADHERREVPVVPYPDYGIAALVEVQEAIRNGRPIRRDGAWAKATTEVILAILQSAAERREISLSHQVPSPE